MNTGDSGQIIAFSIYICNGAGTYVFVLVHVYLNHGMFAWNEYCMVGCIWGVGGYIYINISIVPWSWASTEREVIELRYMPSKKKQINSKHFQYQSNSPEICLTLTERGVLDAIIMTINQVSQQVSTQIINTLECLRTCTTMRRWTRTRPTRTPEMKSIS